MDKKNVLKISEGIDFVRVEEIPMMIANALRPTEPGSVNDPDWEHRASEDIVVRKVTARKHAEHLEQAIHNGTLITRNQFTRIPDPDAVGDRLRNALVDVSDLAVYVSQFGIAVVLETTAPSMKTVYARPPFKDGEKSSGTPFGRKTWTLKKPQRFQGYGRPLYDYLKVAFEAGTDCPSPHDVLDAFRKNRPPEVEEVMPEGLKYPGLNGIKEANINAIRKAIKRLVNRQPNSDEK